MLKETETEETRPFVLLLSLVAFGLGGMGGGLYVHQHGLTSIRGLTKL